MEGAEGDRRHRSDGSGLLVRKLLLLSAWLLFLSAATATVDDGACGNGPESEDPRTCAARNEEPRSFADARVPDGCRVVMAQTTVPPHDDWGVFTLVPRNRGDRVAHGDVVLQVTDPVTSVWDDMLRDGYVVPAQLTGAQFEARQVRSAVPGIGSLAQVRNKNILPFVPVTDEAGLTRQAHPGAGAVTHYHNYTWYFSQRVEAGGELYRSTTTTTTASDLDREPHPDASPVPTEGQAAAFQQPRSPEWLRQNGYCLDNIQPKRTSLLKGAGRAVVSNRAMRRGTVLAPVPVLPLPVSALESDSVANTNAQQLVQNYCFGHPRSQVVLYPYGPTVHLINHYNNPNAFLRWAQSTQFPSVDTIMSASVKSNRMLLELVANRDIQQGEEITIDYGRAWEDAWWKHVRAWEQVQESIKDLPEDLYAPATVIDDASKTIRTETEQKDHPYPSNILITCFYKYTDRTESDRRKAEQQHNRDAVTTFRWKMTRGIYDLKNLRPCNVLKRKQTESGRSAYAVRMLNRPDLDPEEVIPEHQLHIVTHVPRSAIRFMDRQYTTDQHLKGAFRHTIGLGNIFPQEWIDAGVSNDR